MENEARLSWLLCALVTIGQLAMVIYLPSLPQISIDLHTSPELTETTITLFLLSFGLSQLIYGSLSDHFGRKPLILIGILLYSAFSLISALAPNIEVLLCARFLEGMGAGAITTLARASINDYFTGKKLTSTLSYTTVAASVATMLSPTIGGWLTADFDWRANFYFLTLYALCFFFLTSMWLKHTKPEKNSEHSILRTTLLRYKQLLSNAQYLLFMLIACTSFAGTLIYYAASPFIFQHVLSLSPKQYGYLFLLTSGSFISGSFMNNLFHDYEPQRIRLAALGLVIATLCMLTPGLFNKISVLYVVLPMMLYMFCCAIVFPSAMACAVRLLKPIAGTAAAVLGCCQILSASFATTIMAHLPQNTQVPMALAMLTTALLSSFLVYFALKKTKI